MYLVRHISLSCRRGRGLHSLVDWKGFGQEEISWIPAWYVLDPQLIWEFHHHFFPRRCDCWNS